jgi:hypothetical protein
MRPFSWEVRFALALILLSASLYLLHYVMFADPHHLVFWTTTSIAFLPISVLFVTVIINRLLVRQERRLITQKLNMLIGTFFSVIGTPLLKHCAACDPHVGRMRTDLREAVECSEKQLRRVQGRLEQYEYAVDVGKDELERLREFLMAKSDLLLRMLENPHLLEHASFTELLRAVFHLSEELTSRGDFAELPHSDYTHLGVDVQRVYGLIVREWLSYMRYLRANYPFLFSFALRTNPFEAGSPVVVE